MAAPGSTTALIIAALILVFGIIHLGIGIGIVGRYRQYDDVFRQSVGLSAFNIIIGLYGIAIGILGLFCISAQRAALGKAAAVAGAVLGVFALASLISALILNTQAISYVKSRIAYRMTLYSSIEGSRQIVDAIQTNYQCCGQNLWLDWGPIQLGGASSTGTGIGTGTGTGTGTGITTGTGTGTGAGITTGTGTGTGITAGINTGRRRRNLPQESSPLIRAVRQRRQISGSSSTIYGLPSSYGFTLPASCCRSGGQTVVNSLASYCTFSSQNGTDSFYIDGCIPAVSNVVVSQITGIVVVNTCLAILAFVFIPILMRLFPSTFDVNNPDNKQPLPNEMYQEQQQQYQPQQQQYQPQQQQYQLQQQEYPYGGYYANTNGSNVYNNYGVPPYAVYQ